jgi:hypothetical protein
MEPVTMPTREPLPGTGGSEASTQSAESPGQRDIEIHALKDLVIKKDLELETLKKELQSIRKQLDSQSTVQDSQKRKLTPPSKSQQISP